MAIKPNGSRIAIIKQEIEEQTASGIIIPDTAKDSPQIGKVVAIGTDLEMKERFEIGDIIAYTKYAGNELKHGGVEYLILNDDDIIAYIEGD